MAKGIIAIGGIAKGVVAIGGLAIGGLAFGGGAIGGIAYGGGALGLLACGGGALALVAALGGGVIAPIALGGGFIGYFGYGGFGIGVHVLDGTTKDPAAQRFFLPWAETLMEHFQWTNLIVLLLMIGAGTGLPLWLERRLARTTAYAEHARSPGRAWKLSAAVILAVVVLNCVIAVIALRPLRSRPQPLAPQAASTPVRVVAVHAYKGDLGIHLSAIGTVESSNTVLFAIPSTYVQTVVKKFDAGGVIANRGIRP